MYKCNLCKMLLNNESNMKKHIVLSHGALIDASVIGDYYNTVFDKNKWHRYLHDTNTKHNHKGDDC